MSIVIALEGGLEIYRAIKKYGPLLVQAGVDLKDATDKLRNLFAQHPEHPSLTDAERADMLSILEADPATIGFGGSQTIGDELPPVPPTDNGKGFPVDSYFKFLDPYPDVNTLNAGDRIYQTDESPAHWVVTQVGVFMPGVPDPRWRQVWPA